ncbi:hypothetical protein EX30DRAFT_158281 [Ascodesmis nigricans]|uniref:Uncharacterized protein n=1 Tax=Ascodesmis nigricans TaxID=341454 RepID=A0A4V3SI26_9PEZI|nr:hypothetical protein EX30DRAFT_158281 [Ascodesmis nigricans]
MFSRQRLPSQNVYTEKPLPPLPSPLTAAATPPPSNKRAGWHHRFHRKDPPPPAPPTAPQHPAEHAPPLPDPLPPHYIPPPPSLRPPPHVTSQPPSRKLFHLFTISRSSPQPLIPTHPSQVTTVHLLRSRPPELGATTYTLTPAAVTPAPDTAVVAVLDAGIVATDWAVPGGAVRVVTDQERFEISEKTLRKRRKRYKKDRRRLRRMAEEGKSFAELGEGEEVMFECVEEASEVLEELVGLDLEELGLDTNGEVEWDEVEFSPPESEDEEIVEEVWDDGIRMQ